MKTQNTEEERRQLVKEFNDSNALEGIQLDEKTLILQEMWIKGELSGDDYLKHVLKVTLEEGE